MDNFVRKYALSKTLRFELKPVGETAEKIEDFKNKTIASIVEQDKKRAQDYKKIKKIIDDYHRYFIEQVLGQEILTGTDIKKASDAYNALKATPKDKDKREQFNNIQGNLRTKIAKAFKEQSGKYCLFDAGLLNEKGTGKNKTKGILWLWLKHRLDNKQINQSEFEEAEKLIKSFDKFYTYFKGFNENRQNMYSPEGKQTAISNRIINENMVKHFNNCRNFQEIQNNYKDLAEQLKDYEGIFIPAIFNQLMNQTGITKYNRIIGREPGKNYDEGVNQIINKYRQDKNIEHRQLPIMTALYKQILSDVEDKFKIDVFENPKQMSSTIAAFYNELFIKEKILHKFQKCFKEYFIEENLDSIYIRGEENLAEVLKYLYNGWISIPEKLKSYIGQDENDNSKGEKSFYSIKEIQNSINQDANDKKDLEGKNIFDYFNSFKNRYEIEKGNYQEIEIAKRIEQTYLDVKLVLDSQTEDGNLQNNEDKKKIQQFMDSLNSAVRFIKPLYIKKKGKWLLDSVDYNTDFYEEFNDLYEKLTGITKLYDKTRNHVTKKPYKTDKFKITFENGYFLSGWATDYEKNGALLFIKENQYYLGVVNSKLTNEDIVNLTQNSKLADAVRIIYDFQKPDNKNVPRLFIRSKGDSFAPAVEKYNLPITKIIDIYDNDKFTTGYKKKNPVVFREALTSLIDYFKEGFKKHESYKHYEFNWKPSDKYQDISEFYNDTASSCYKLHEEKINFGALRELANRGKLYLFEIYSKDFSFYSKGRPNLHTSYWKLLFSPENLNDLVLKLNGQAEIFFRPASLKKNETAVHKARQPINNKNPLNPKRQSSFNIDIIKDRRFTADKFFLHCPITINFKSPSSSVDGFNYKFNDCVNENLKHNHDIQIIGIDRGERNLLYYTIIDQKGNILRNEQDSFNTVVNSYKNNGQETPLKTDYHKLLDEKEKQRDDARKSWSTIENIKELKSGYLSHIVHKLASLMTDKPAIVVLEDLSIGFKRSRFFREKQVYQKFENMLIDKLNYLVFKNKKAGEPGHYLKGYQLTAPIASFKDIGKQTGFLFYVLPHYTSNIDPVTGFVNLLDAAYESVKKSQEFFRKFDNIVYNAQKDYFMFSFNYANFPPDKSGSKKDWTVCTAGKERYRYDKDKKEYVCYDVTAELKRLFKENNSNYQNGENLVNAIANKDNKAFFERLHFLLGLTLQLRHIYKDGDEEKDFILSPYADKNGNFFDSRKANGNQPQDADANGAFNIARKGLMVLEQIREPSKGKPDVIKNTDWFNFAQSGR